MVPSPQAPHRSAPFWPALARQHTRLHRSARLARDRTANPVEQRPIRSFAPARTPKIQAKAIRSPASAQLPQHSRRRQIPIAPAALSVPHTPRFRALTLFGRRLSERGDGLRIPASENLHKSCPDGPEVQLPLYPRKRTQVGHRAMSVSCQQETLVPDRSSEAWGLNSAHIHGTHVPVEEPSTASQADNYSAQADTKEFTRSVLSHHVQRLRVRECDTWRGARELLANSRVAAAESRL